MKVLITGSGGFVGKNLIAMLKHSEHELLLFDKENTVQELDGYCKNADFVFHLAGINRPKDPAEYMEGNYGLTSKLLDLLKKHQNKCPIMISSSIQAALANDYGTSKRAGEELLFQYSHETDARVLVYRFPNIFGKWSQPNYNSAIATFCYNSQRGLPISIHDSEVNMTLVYIDDVVDELLMALNGQEHKIGAYCEVPIVHHAKLGDLVKYIESFGKCRSHCQIPDLSDSLVKKLYSTYLSFLPTDQFSYPLKMNVDQRGSFTELIKTPDRGQVSVNISKPGITKGNHWHNTKVEKFLVVSGEGVVRFRSVNNSDVIEYFVKGECLEVIDVPVGYTHSIENLGMSDMVTIMWVNEVFNPDVPDTYFEMVKQ